MERFGGLQFQQLFRQDEVKHDNLLFKLHHQINFFVLLVGVIFIFGENYLNGNSIVCLSGGDYAKQYCWLHGTSHIDPVLAKGMKHVCSISSSEDERETHYYLWLPFILGVCMGLVKLPRVVWKRICERGLMASLVADGAQKADKIAERFNKIKQRSVSYLICFAACELLNIVMLLICFFILDKLLNGKFWHYGVDVTEYYSNKLTFKELKQNSDLDNFSSSVNPMCGLFPTVVACNTCTGAIGGGCDLKSILCILSNNLFNQYFFLILWFWWVFLLSISIFGVIYRAAQMSTPSVSKAVLQTYLTPYGLESAVNKLSLRPADYFLLGRLAINVKGSTMGEVLKQLKTTSASNDEGTDLLQSNAIMEKPSVDNTFQQEMNTIA